MCYFLIWSAITVLELHIRFEMNSTNKTNNQSIKQSIDIVSTNRNKCFSRQKSSAYKVFMPDSDTRFYQKSFGTGTQEKYPVNIKLFTFTFEQHFLKIT